MTKTSFSHRASSIASALAAAGLSLAFVQPMQAEDKPAEPPPPTAAAPAPTPTPAPAPKWYDDITANGFLSASYSYNFNRPASGTNQYRVFDFDDNTFKIDVAALVLQKAVAKPGEAGFRVDAEAGSSIPRVSAAYGLFQGQDFDLKQAFVSYIAPVGSGLRLDVGKFVTHFGQEVIDEYDNYNDNATRSILFGYAIPFTHTGIKATYTFSDQLNGMLEICNGWDVARDNNSSKSVGAQLNWTPIKTVSVALNFMTGPERTNVNSDPRSDYDLVAQWKLTDTTVFTLDAVWGTEKGAVAPGQRATWWGIVGYARLGVTSDFAVILRGEYFDDGDGARTTVAQKLKEVTLTPELKVGPHIVFRGDLRIDFSDVAVFQKHDGGSGKQQPTFLLNAIYLF
jgi:Putative beta-barrel porin-2, OmpL-like. bbp2